MIRLKNRFGKANRKEMSWMSDLMETLRQGGARPPPPPAAAQPLTQPLH